jgi:anti-sigma regulatory factor (Ser/Thr protein kinase)
MEAIDDIFSQSLSYTRTLIADLCPPVLHDLGLQAALQWLADQISHQYPITVDLQVPPGQVVVSEDQAYLLYRAIHELVINVVKHAQTSHAVIALSVGSHDEIHVRVTDQGRGFGPLVIDTKCAGEQFGLWSIRERLEAMGGWFRVESAPGRGTTITVGLQLEQARPSPAGPGTTSRDERPHRSAQQTTDVHRVLLADDHALVRQGLRAILEGFQDVSIVGEASNGVEADVSLSHDGRWLAWALWVEPLVRPNVIPARGGRHS